MSSLESSLKDHVSLALRPVVVDHLWGQQPTQFIFSGEHQNLEAYFDIYFKYYAQQCDLIGHESYDERGDCSPVQTHRDIMVIAQLLQQPLTRAEVRKRMSDYLKSEDKDHLESSINFVARLLLMIRIGDVTPECSRGRPLKWKEGDLGEFVHNYFSACPTRGNDRIKLEKSFNALNVQRIGGIKILWTDNLADHLRMEDDDTAVFVFHHASFLEHQSHNNSSMYPPRFIDETLRTITLLFPRYDLATEKWYKKAAANSACGLDLRLIGIGNLNAEERQINSFNYWRDRLVILKEVYDEARPNTLSQFWHDRRNGPQWYTFWVALLVLILTIFTIFLSVVQCVEGALQVYLALK